MPEQLFVSTSPTRYAAWENPGKLCIFRPDGQSELPTTAFEAAVWCNALGPGGTNEPNQGYIEISRSGELCLLRPQHKNKGRAVEVHGWERALKLAEAFIARVEAGDPDPLAMFAASH